MSNATSLAFSRNLRKWTNSYVITIPPVIVENLDLEEGEELEAEIRPKD